MKRDDTEDTRDRFGLVRWVDSFVPAHLSAGHELRTAGRNLALGAFAFAAVIFVVVPLHRVLAGRWSPPAELEFAAATLMGLIPFVMYYSQRVMPAFVIMLITATATVVTLIGIRGGLQSHFMAWIAAPGFIAAIGLPLRYVALSWIPLALTLGAVLGLDAAELSMPMESLRVDTVDILITVGAFALFITLWAAYARRAAAEVVATLELREAELRRRQLEFDAVIDNLPLAIVAMDNDGTLRSASGSAASWVLGAGTDRSDAADDAPERPALEAVRQLACTSSPGAFTSGQIQFGARLFEAWAQASQSDGQGAGSIYAVLYDVTEIRENEARRALADTVFETSSQGLFVAGAQGEFQRINPTFSKITGLTEAEVTGQVHPFLDFSQDPLPDGVAAVREAMESHGRWEGETTAMRADGEVYVQLLVLSRLPAHQGLRGGYMGMVTDVTETRRARERLKNLAERDELTGLPNRRHFLGELSQRLDRATAHEGRLALLFVDLDGFKGVNDNFGHAAGDAVLIEVSRRLQDCVREDDLVGRLAGDEFTVVLSGRVGLEAAEQLAHRVVEVMRQPFDVEGRQARIGASVGMAVFPEHADSREALVRAADAAMYAAKEGGRDRYVVFNEQMRGAAERQERLHTRLRRAVDLTEFELVWQPYAELELGTITGVEALVRWREDELGLLRPSTFLHVIEELGMARAFGSMVLDLSFAQAAAWRQSGDFDGFINVNVSPRHLADAALARDIDEMLRRYELPPETVEVELTEGLFSEDQPHVTEALASLREIGVRLAVDDFGTGRSSLWLLQRQQIDRVKIDGSFVAGLAHRSDARAIARGIVSIGQSLGASITGEMVEEAADLSALRELGCDSAQGYLLAAPLPSDQLTPLLREGRLALPRPSSRHSRSG